jgi:OHCU decarboxylase
MKTGTTLSELNTSDQAGFSSIVGPVFEHSRWIAEATWTRRPFADLDNLHQALCDTVRGSGEEKQLELIRAHPDLVGRAALAGTLTQSSTAEQSGAGLDRLTDRENQAFQSFNQQYRDKFGFPFVICARLNKKEAILRAFPVRLKNSREQEITTALEEIYKIAYFRLQAIVGPE